MKCGSTTALVIGVYCIRKGQMLIILLSGGDKSSQDTDIEKAITLAREWRD
jgi:putative addiction module killer protein